MLPNWLYGKSKSKLAELLGGGGAPSDYNQVKAQVTQNTEDIASLDDTLDTKAALTQISNPNLLDNPWFTVNQRGQSSYTNTGSDSSYSFDRWVIGSANTAISKDSNTGKITFSATAAYATLLQNFSSDALEVGKTYTLSVMFSDGTIESKTITPVDGASSFSQWEHAPSFHCTISNQYSNLWKVFVFDQLSAAPNSVSFKAIKLELGSVSTLAMDTAPDYATELLKCQRYFVRFGSNESVAAYKYNLGMAFENASNAYYNAVLSIPMRTTPSISYQGSWAIGSKALSGITVDSMINNIVKLVCTTSETLTPTKIELLENKEAGINYIDLSAEL